MTQTPIVLAVAFALTADPPVYVACCTPPRYDTPVVQTRYIDGVVDHSHADIVPAVYVVT